MEHPHWEGEHRWGLPKLMCSMTLILDPLQSSASLQQFQSAWSDLFDDILSTEVNPATNEVCSCGTGGLRKYRCTDSGCLGVSARCRECFLQAHKTAPFHWAQEWNGNFFECKDLSDLGLVYTLGHGGDTCPRAGNDDKGIQLIIVDSNSIHSTWIHFCNCFGVPNHARQLTWSCLFPATINRLAMAFTFNMLKQFDIHCFESKKSAFDYIGALRHLTNNACTELVPVCITNSSIFS